MLVEGKLQHDFELTGLQICLVARTGDAPGISDNTVEFPSLEREHDLLGSLVACYCLQPGTEQRIQGGGEGVLIAANTGRADLQGRASENLLQGRGGGPLPDEQTRDLVVHAAQPAESGGVEFGL